ncbi:stress response protein NST1 isoform X2 [Drosophila hydei]|uniref:Stress response protein NST1 isoform X2 n=1 Tax=Drosophila hydei TaxID=7224 RepID=A0A6J1MCY9_DROHY|nr:stress response protein NST1 isoform X2 [Drosophila hydei]
MANLSNNEYKKSDFDWNEISVGDYNLDHSQNFFTASSNRSNAMGDTIDFLDNYNSKNANLNFDWNETKTSANKMEYSSDLCAAASSSNKENLSDQFNTNWRMTRQKQYKSACDQNLIEEDVINLKTTELIKKEIQDESVCDQNFNAVNIVSYKTEQASYQNCDEDDIVHIESKRQMQLQLDLSTDSLQGEEETVDSPIPEHTESLRDQEVDEILGLKPRLKLDWTPLAKSQAEQGPVGKAPRVYECKNTYQAKREMMMRQREEEERKARQFHSKPVPNFKALHKRLADTIVIHRITVPVTPETLKHSYEHLERRKRREENSKILQQEYDIAKNVRRAGLAELKPFQLRSDQRVRERREYNNVVQCNLDEKKKKEDEQRKQREMEEAKELRKMTEFKARPNPFTYNKEKQ